MTLIKSISGIRGTIGGPAGDNLTPLDVVKFTTAYVRFTACRSRANNFVSSSAATPGFRARWSATWSKAPCWAAAPT